jgi:hypothetical protein
MGKTYTEEEVSKAVNAGIDLVRDEVGDSERDSDLLNLAVNAVMTLLEHPGEGLTLDDVIESNYESSPDEVRGWF